MAKKIIYIPYEPRNWAKIFHSAVVRWIVLVLHRRAGKTTAAFNHLQRDALLNGGTRYAYIAPTFKQAKRIVWAMAKFYAKDIPGVEFNESELLIKFQNGSEIMILGSDNPDSLRGIALWGCFLDEYPLQSPVIFTEIVTKCLADHQGYCIFGGTPKGKGHFFRVYEVALKNESKEWCLVYRTIDESLKTETGETIENLKKSLKDDKQLVTDGIMTEDEFQQEWYNSFEAAIKGAVYLKQLSFMREKGRIRNVPYDPSLPVYTIWDLGVSKSDAMSVSFVQKPTALEVHMIDYFESIGTGLNHCIKVVKEKPYIYGKHFAPHDIRNKELLSGKSRLDGAKVLGIDFEVIPSVSVERGIELARALLQRMWIDKQTCALFLDFIGSYHYEFIEKLGRFSKDPVHDFTSHAADNLRYIAVVEDEMTLEALPESNDSADVSWMQDEYVGQHEPEDLEGGKKVHPMMKGVDIGKMGHDKKKEE